MAEARLDPSTDGLGVLASPTEPADERRRFPCPYCGKPLTRIGRSRHVHRYHPERFDEFQRLEFPERYRRLAATRVGAKDRAVKAPHAVAWSGPTSKSIVLAGQRIKTLLAELTGLMDEVGTIAARQETELRFVRQENAEMREHLDKLEGAFSSLKKGRG